VVIGRFRFVSFYSYTDDTPLIRDEFLNETPVGPQDLGAEPILRVAMDECDSWSPSVPKEIVKSLKDKQVSSFKYNIHTIGMVSILQGTQNYFSNLLLKVVNQDINLLNLRMFILSVPFLQNS
jgi:hypothetical protein